MLEDILCPHICPKFLSDSHYREGHIHIIAPGEGTVIMGLHTPEMKTVAKGIVSSGKADWALDGLEKQLSSSGKESLYHEERMVWGLVIDYMKVPFEERKERILKFLPSIDNWAICDNFCCNSKWVKKEDKARLRELTLSLINTPKDDPGYEFTVRTGIILSMVHLIGPEDLEKTFRSVEEAGFREGEPYYIRMGVAWLLATALSKDEERTREFARKSSLPSDILKLYVRKARESRRTKEVVAM